MKYSNFNPRSSCEERREGDRDRLDRALISIHAPHARSDATFRKGYTAALISIHAPHARSDDGAIMSTWLLTNFNPRSSCEERHDVRVRICLTLLISIHAPHARSDFQKCQCFKHSRISIHAPHARSDMSRTKNITVSMKFQSTLLMRGATRQGRPFRYRR